MACIFILDLKPTVVLLLKPYILFVISKVCYISLWGFMLGLYVIKNTNNI